MTRNRFLEKNEKGLWSMSFGKHRGELVEDVAIDDPGYLRWMIDEMDLPDEVYDTIENLLGEEDPQI
jgi:hypothetical protein